MSTLSNKEKQIFFHVGTGKTGTTFLQYKVFPLLQGIKYIQRTRYKKATRLIQNSNHSKYLVSREFDRQLQSEIELFAETFPEAIPIIVFRRQDSYIASQYRRFVKNGFTCSFTEFFDVQNDNGFFEKKHLFYMQQIELLEKTFSQKPIVLIYEDLKTDPTKFIKDIATRLDVTIDIGKVDLSRKHTSYSEKQLKGIKALGRFINMGKTKQFNNTVLQFIWRLLRDGLRYLILYISALIPNAFFSEEPLMSPDELKAVKEFYEDDWNACLNYANSST